jgi:peptidoglycan/xylan/chitin deacetylase (PgdA/CDA1 family)
MKYFSLIYHDVIEKGAAHLSGFAGADADIYKLEKDFFETHLEKIEANNLKPELVTDFSKEGSSKTFLTFDDGGKSAMEIADALERRGWRGHFFIATDFIDSPEFLTADEIRKLDDHGHVIGSHSASHPLRMSACSPAKMREEWKISSEKLSEILNKKIMVASVPGGQFSKEVAIAAEECGIKTLFNSEPVSSVYDVGKCKVFGRYSVQQMTSANEAAAMASGDLMPRLKQYAFWNLKKTAKKAGGEIYLKIRKKVLSKR